MNVVTKEVRSFEDKVQDTARSLWNEMRGETPTLFQTDFWMGRMLEWSMDRPALKTDLFRLVDVLPGLRSASSVQQHVKEYLQTDGKTLPKGAGSLFRLASSGLPSTLTAKITEKAVREMAHRFIVGENLDEAMPRLRALYEGGIGATVDLLGEVTVSDEEADTYSARYLELIDRLAQEAVSWPSARVLEEGALGPVPRVNVSLKISALEPHLDPVDPAGSVARASRHVIPILLHARDRDVFVNFDMEQWAIHGITLDLLETVLCHEDLHAWPHIGVAVQAYTKRAHADLRRLLELAQGRGVPITVRLVKGAYWDYEVVHARQHGYECPVFEDKASTDANFEMLSEFLLRHHEHLTPAFGSHNLRSIASILAYADELDVPPSAYEFQMLYGMAEPLRSVLHERRHRVRLYTPVGELLPGMAYLVRRLLENTSNEGFLRLSYHDKANIDALLVTPSQSPVGQRIVESPPAGLDDPFTNCPHSDFTRADERDALAKALEAVSGQLPIHVPTVVAGNHVECGISFNRISPNDGESVVARVSDTDTDTVAEAVQSAWDAWPQWRDRPLRERAELLEVLARRLERDRHRLAALQVHEVAKPWAEADADVTEAIDFCRYYARLAMEELAPRDLSHVPGESNVVTYEGRGPTAIIAPWNFPLAILCGMSTAALVSGNPVLMKPAEQSSAVAYALFEHMLDAGFPPKVVQFLPGHGETIGPVLVDHPLVAQVAFTGSREVGLSILERIGKCQPGQPELKRAICEMGGKNAIVIDEDADLDEAVRGVIQSAFAYAGQKCSACSRAIVLDSVLDRFVSRLIEATRSLKLTSAVEPNCQIPPVVDELAYRRLLAVCDTPGPGTEVLFQRDTVPNGGHFIPPIVLRIDDRQHELLQRELFGPVLALTCVDSFEEALDCALESEFALTGAVYSRQPSHLTMARERFRVGNLYLNRGCTGSMVGRQPFGGFRMSGTDAKAGGPGYLLNFIDARCVTENTMRRGFTPEVMM